jgi:hypothetical protein
MVKKPPPLLRAAAARRAPDYTAKFYARLPVKPLQADRAAAVDYHAAITDVIDQDAALPPGDPAKLSRHDRHNLQRLERRWRRRAAGEDPRWMVAGVKPGRLPRAIEDCYKRTPHPEFDGFTD